MKSILVINSGSSSLKYQYFKLEDLSVINAGIVENIGQEVKDHASALVLMLEALKIENLETITLIAHRVVHGGEIYNKATLVDEDVIANIAQLSALAPLHNPANLLGITAIKKLAPKVTQVAVFDTAFHQSMPRENYLYALPQELYTKHHIRRYGFHGSSHKYVSNEAAHFLEIAPEQFNAITLHLGNGASVCAIKEGKSFDTSMGFTPLEGLIMGTRSGNIDPAIVSYLLQNDIYTLDQIDNVFNKESGLKALCGDNNMKNILSRKDEDAQLARIKFVQSIASYIGAYAARLPKLNALIFTGGIGENSQVIIEEVITLLGDNFNITLDKNLNIDRKKKAQMISDKESSVNVLVIKTDEEKQIAKEALALL